MKIGVIQFPGSNCERETKLALLRTGFTPVDCFWHRSAEFLHSLDGFVIVGGFSYEDRVRSGLIAAKDPFMTLLMQEAARGKPILGICNGAQILIESGLVPGFTDHRVTMALAPNHRVQAGQLIGTGFYNNRVFIRTKKGEPIRLPIAHAEGRFLVTPQLYQALQAAGASCYYYCDANGDIVPEFPSNPNGSNYNLAAVSNFAGNVLAMMPHPERTPAGDSVFEHFFNPFKTQAPDLTIKISHDPRDPLEQKTFFKPYIHNASALHYWVTLLIHDNEAISLETSLQQMGLPISLKKRVHWEINVPAQVDKINLNTLIIETDALFNQQKEALVMKPASTLVYFVRQQEDDRALSKQIMLRKRLHQPELTLIREVVWVINCLPEHINTVKTLLENQRVLANPLAHRGWLDEA